MVETVASAPLLTRLGRFQDLRGGFTAAA